MGFRLFAFFWAKCTFCSSYFTLFCLTMNCSWFLRRILSDSTSFSFSTFDSSLTACSYFFSSSILSSYSSSVFMLLRAFPCSFFIFSRLFFYSSKFYNSVRKYFSSSSFASRFRLLWTVYSWRLML